MTDEQLAAIREWLEQASEPCGNDACIGEWAAVHGRALLDEVERLRVENAAFQEAINDYHADAVEWRDKYNTERERNSRLERSNASNLKACDELKAKLEQTTALLIAECDETVRLRAELGSTKTTSDQRFWLLDKKQRELDQAQDEAIALRAKVEALETERDEARAAIKGAYEALKGADCGGNSWRALHDMAYNAHRHLACVLATVKMRDTKPPKLPRPKGPRSKPNEVRARVKRSDLIGEHWSESSGVYQVQCEIDGVTACGYAYCMPGDEFSRTDGYRRALRRAEQALESALSYTGTLVGNCCVTKNYPAKMWEWWRTNPVDNGPAS